MLIRHRTWHFSKVCHKIVSLRVMHTLARCRNSLRQCIVVLYGMP